ncbi:uncharacterized protein LOC115720601 isoform X1 [Cannabis sativa]|uniref:uncharacterized protein LOC115720601 isoform X1 n=1 Tax=Cannabis sativa TaxID=3483 RepID=UPI0029CA63D0|nr:uncharacterized protein LOC115720601 isoform X1 [Cannabis sativa]
MGPSLYKPLNGFSYFPSNQTLSTFPPHPLSSSFKPDPSENSREIERRLVCFLREKKTMATVALPPPQPIEPQKKNRIQVSNTKKPLFFYVNLAKRYIQQHNEVELSALGMEVSTSTVGMKDESKGRLVQKAKIEIVLGKSENFDSLVAAATAAIVEPEPESEPKPVQEVSEPKTEQTNDENK